MLPLEIDDVGTGAILRSSVLTLADTASQSTWSLQCVAACRWRPATPHFAARVRVVPDRALDNRCFLLILVETLVPRALPS